MCCGDLILWDVILIYMDFILYFVVVSYVYFVIVCYCNIIRVYVCGYLKLKIIKEYNKK